MRTMQKNVKAFCEQNHLDAPASIWLMDALSELGEVSKECLKNTDYGKRPETKATEKMIIEVGDVLFSLIGFANTLDIDLQVALAAAMMKYDERIEGTGSMEIRKNTQSKLNS